MLSLHETINFCEQQIKKYSGKAILEFFLAHERISEVFIQGNKISYLKSTNEKELGIKAGTSKGIGFYFTTGFIREVIEKGIEEAIEMGQILNEEKIRIADFYGVTENISFTDEDLEGELEKLQEYASTLITKIEENYNPIRIDSLRLTCQNINEVIFNSNKVKVCMQKKIYVADGLIFQKKLGKISPFYVLFDGACNLDELNLIHVMEEFNSKNILNLPTIHIGSYTNMNILLSPYAVQQLIIEPILSNCNGTQLVNRQSMFTVDDLGKKIFSPKLTIIDDNRLVGFINSRKYDREGNLMEPLTIIQDGVLNKFLLDVATSKRLKLSSTNRSGGGADDVGLIMPTNIVIPGNDQDLQTIISHIKEGIWIERFSGKVERINGDFSGNVRPGYYIKDGKLQGLLHEVMINGNAFELAKNIDQISSNQKKYGNVLLPYILTGKVKVVGNE